MAGKRETIEPQAGDKRYTRRDKAGKFTEQDDVSRASAQDQKRTARNEPPRGQGDRGDRKGR
jgi:hypothetical protein